MKKAHILVVEDEALLYKRMQRVLKKENYTVSDYTPSVAEAIASIKKNRPDIVLLDIDLQGEQTGLDLGKQLYESYKIPFIYVSAYDDDQTFYEGLSTHHEQFIVKTKPRLNPKEIIRAIQTVLKHYETKISKPINGIIGLIDYLENLKGYGKDTLSKVNVPYDDILYFTTRLFVNKSDELEALKPNYLWFITQKKERFFYKASLKDLNVTLPIHFVRINDSCIVNLNPNAYKGRINGSKIKIGTEIFTITKTYKENFEKIERSMYKK